MAKPQTEASGAQTVAQIATIQTDIDSRATFLIGTFGPQSSRQALVRLADGDVRKVGAGDTLEGGKIVAVSDDRLVISQARTTRTLRLP